MWHYGDALEWRHRMIVLSESAEDYAARGFTPERLASGLASIQRRYGMPIDARPREPFGGQVGRHAVGPIPLDLADD